MANKTFNTRVKNKRDTAANWEAVATTFQPLDGELIIVDTSAGKTRFKVGRYDTAKGRLLYYNEIPFADEYLYNDLNEAHGKIYEEIKGIDDKSIIEMTLEPAAGNGTTEVYKMGLWQFSQSGFYKIKFSVPATSVTMFQVFARETDGDGTTNEDFSTNKLKICTALGGDAQTPYLFALADYLDNDSFTSYHVQFLNLGMNLGSLYVNTYDKSTQKWSYVCNKVVKANKVSNALTLTKGDTTTTFDGSTAQTVSIPTKTSELTNDSNFTTQTDLNNLTNTVVSYNAQENITDEQKATARTNIGAISEADLVQPDWNQNDATAKDYIKNRICYEEETVTELGNTAEVWVSLVGEEASTSILKLLDIPISYKIKGILYENQKPSKMGNYVIYYGGERYGENPEYVMINTYSPHNMSFNGMEASDFQFVKIENTIKQIDSKFIPTANPDWNQNDETAKDYIKNRFGCYYDDGSLDIIKDTSNLPLIHLELGKTYNVKYSLDASVIPSGNGIDWVCKNIHELISSIPESENILCIGNLNAGKPDPYLITNIPAIETKDDTIARLLITGSKLIAKDLPSDFYPKRFVALIARDAIENNISYNRGANIDYYDINYNMSLDRQIDSIVNSTNSIKLLGNSLLSNCHFPYYPYNRKIGAVRFTDVSFNDIKLKLGETYINYFENAKAKEAIQTLYKYGICYSSVVLRFKETPTNNPIQVLMYSTYDNTEVTTPYIVGTFVFGNTNYKLKLSANNNNNQIKVEITNIGDDTLASKSDVLTKTNTTAFTPTADYQPATKKYVDDNKIIVDTALSDTSTNPVQNKVIKAAIDNKTEDFKIAATVDSNKNITLDKTYDEIKAAIESGKNVYLLQRATDADNGNVNNIKYYYYATINNNIVFYSGIITQLREYFATASVFVTVNSTSARAAEMLIPSLEYINSEIQGIPLPDTELSITSEKPVQNKVITAEIQTINNKLGGLTGAMHFIGKATVDITDGSTTDPVIADYDFANKKEKGDVILGKDDHKEFVWNGSVWEELGDEGSYALKTTTINGKALSDNITLTASDVGAASASAIETMQAAIDSKPSAADAVYTATAASTDGVAYTATVSGIDSLTVGASFIMIPNKASTSKAPTLNVNGLGAKPIRRRLSSLTTNLQQGYSTNWIALNKPFTVVYDGTAWVIEGLTKTDGADVYGAVAQATADAKGNNIADTYATIAMLQSLLPKVTTITLTSNWVGDASPYYQDIALSCVTETSIVDLQPTPEQLNSWQDDGIAFTTLSGNGTVRVYVAGGKPSSAISVQVRVQEVTVI